MSNCRAGAIDMRNFAGVSGRSGTRVCECYANTALLMRASKEGLIDTVLTSECASKRVMRAMADILYSGLHPQSPAAAASMPQ
eukprot:6023276-Amphidinium_carterae.1